MYFEYVSLCLFLNWLIYLMPIYCCFYASWFRFYKLETNQGDENIVLSWEDHASTLFLIHVILFIYRFAVSALGDGFYKKKATKKKWYSFNCIYWYVTYYVLLCCIWSDVSWSLLVKRFYSESFQIMTKDKKQSQIIICYFVRNRHVTCMLHQEQEI